jgi:hypothetical protein
MLKRLNFTAAGFILLAFIFIQSASVFSSHQNSLWAVTTHDHAVLEELKNYSYSYLSKARIQVIEFKDDYSIETIPAELAQHLRPFHPESLKAYPDHYRTTSLFSPLHRVKANTEIVALTQTITKESFFERLKYVTQFAPRTNSQSIRAFIEAFNEMGYETRHDFNIEAWKRGTKDPSKYVIVMGHMDTVGNTMGADDNGSGAAGVMEIANALKNFESDYSILFLLTEDEEIGLVGATRYVRNLQKNGTQSDVLFVINMDMIGYNKNGVVDIETEDEFEDHAEWMAALTRQYTSLIPNVLLDAWASDHVPFIRAGIPTVMTIEHWNTHTPCWHKSCDTLDTINSEYAAQILRLNLAATILKAGVKIKSRK